MLTVATAMQTAILRPARSVRDKNLSQILELYLAEARAALSPADQLVNFRRGGYVAQPKQLRFHAAARECDRENGPTQVGFGGARGPGKSHAVMAQIALDDCQRVPGLKYLYLRKIGKQAREQFEDLRRAVLGPLPHQYNRSEGVVYFPNGSRILIGHFNNESDVDAYLGIQYDGAAIEEATALTLTKRQAVRDSIRTSLQGWRPRLYETTNPGGVGHAWFKATYIIPYRQRQERETRFIFATVEDNRFINPDYRRTLEQNIGWRLRAYRYGDWDIVAGQFFTNFRHDVHVLPPERWPFKQIPREWPVWGSLDYGHNHPTSAHLHTMNEGIIYTVGEHWARRWPIKRHAAALHELCREWGRSPRFWYAGLDCFAKRQDEEDGPTIAEKYRAEGIALKPANTNRINGVAEMLDRLGDVEQGIAPRWYIFSICPRLIECIPALEHDPSRPEDVLKVDVDENGQGGDDAYDDTRYGLMVHWKTKRLKSAQVDFYAPASGTQSANAGPGLPVPARSAAEIDQLLAEVDYGD